MKDRKIWGTLHPFLETGEVMGRGVANEEFITSFLEANPFDEYHFFLQSEAQCKNTAESLGAMFPKLSLRFATQYDLPNYLVENSYYAFHLSDWLSGFVPLCSLRNRLAKNIFPVTGPIHSLSYSRYHKEFLQHLWPGCTGRDAIVVTSKAGESVMQRAFASLREGYSLPRTFNEPALRPIPLGIGRFPADHEIPPLRLKKRADLGLAEDDVLLLCLGRISHYSKMDFLPVLRAISNLTQQEVDISKIKLLIAGWNDADDDTAATLKHLAANLKINLLFSFRPANEEKQALYCAADIFVSPSDNLQETFGLTMLEAGAFALPVAASNFNGYRDIIKHGSTGFLASTIGPRQTDILDSVAHLWFDSEYHLALAQQTAVNIEELSHYLSLLIKNKELRLEMGKNARDHIKNNYLWKNIIPAYLEMWNELNKIDVPPDVPSGRPPTHPAHLSYAHIFAEHPSQTLNDNLVLRWTKTGEAVYYDREFPAFYGGMESFLSLKSLKHAIFRARSGVSVRELADALKDFTCNDSKVQQNADFIILWAIKHGLLAVESSKL